MKSNPIMLLLISSYTAMVSVPPGKAEAKVATAIFSAGGSIVLDKAGDEFREAIDHARAAASSLLGEADETGKAWLAQIDEIANRTISDMIGKSEAAATQLLMSATKQLNSLEEKIMVDVSELIRKAECAGKRLTISDLEQALRLVRGLCRGGAVADAPPRRHRDHGQPLEPTSVPRSGR